VSIKGFESGVRGAGDAIFAEKGMRSVARPDDRALQCNVSGPRSGFKHVPDHHGRLQSSLGECSLDWIFSWEARPDQLSSTVAEMHACICGLETQSLFKCCFLGKWYSIKYNSIDLRCCVDADTNMKTSPGYRAILLSCPQKCIPFQSSSILPSPGLNKRAPKISPQYLYVCSFVS